MKRLWSALFTCVTISAANGPIQSFRLPNGLQVRLVEDHERPLVRLEFQVPWGSTEIPPGREELAGFLARLLDASGADGMDREAFLRTMEDSALRYSFHPSSGAFVWSMLSTSQNLDSAFHYLAMAVTRPGFREATLEQQRQALVLEGQARSLRERTEALFLRSLGDLLATPEGAVLTSVQLNDLERLRRRIVRPGRAVLAIYGDLSLDQARQLAALNFGAWGPSLELPAPSEAGSGEVRTWLMGDSNAPLEIWVGSSRGAGRQGVAEDLAARLLRRELANEKPSLFGKVTLRVLPGPPWVIQVTPVFGTPAEVALRNVQGLLAHFRGRIWTDSDLTWAWESRQVDNCLDALHPRRVTEALAAELPTAAEPPSPGDIQKIIQAWIDPLSLRWMIHGAKAEDSASLEKQGSTPGK